MAQLAPIVRAIIDEGDNAIEMDVTLTENHEASVELTRHPIEEGASPTDHARLLPEKITLDSIASNAPLFQPDSRSSPPGEAGFAQRTLAKIYKLKNDRRAVKVKTTLRTYENMILTGMRPVADKTTGDIVRLTMTFEEIRFVRSERVRLERVTAPTTQPTRPTTKTDQGKTPPENANEEQRRSIMKTFLDARGVTTPNAGIAPK